MNSYQCIYLKKMEYVGDLEGTVISVNPEYACFEIEGPITAHMSLILTRGKIQKLPMVGSKILIKDGHVFDSIYVASKSSKIKGNLQTDCPINSFLKLINTYRLTPADIAKFHEISKEFEKSFINLETELKESLLLSLLEGLILLKTDKQTRQNYFTTSIISKISLTTIKSCKYVEIKSNKYVKFPYWTFGVHTAVENVMLFGYLEIHTVYGFYMIKDDHYQMACVIITDNCKKTNSEISQLHNTYVVIEKYTIITEIFKEDGIPNVEYIIVNVDNIHKIYSAKYGNSLFGIKSKEVKYPKVMYFKLLRKSSVCVGTRNAPELLLQVLISSSSADLYNDEIYLVLPSRYVCLNVHLKEGSTYNMYHHTSLKVVIKPEVTKIKNLKVYEIPDGDCYFEPVNVNMRTIMSKPLSVSECKSCVETSRDLVTFRGIIKNKRFTDPLASRTTKIPTVYGFGTPGGKVHQIVFCHVDNNSKIFLDCYLNNWENILMPLGLVPEMEVIVRHAVPQSKRYLKSTILTSFEVVSYKPSFRFASVNLYDNIDWGMPISLSIGHKIPVDVLVYGKAYTIFILKLSIALRCVGCNQIIGNSNHGAQNTCTETRYEIEFSARFNARDRFGQTSVTTKLPEILRVLLDLTLVEFEEWILAFKYIGFYSYNYFDGTTPVWDDLTCYLKNFYNKKVIFDLKCRRMRDSTLLITKRAAWYCVDVRIQNSFS